MIKVAAWNTHTIVEQWFDDAKKDEAYELYSKLRLTFPEASFENKKSTIDEEAEALLLEAVDVCSGERMEKDGTH